LIAQEWVPPAATRPDSEARAPSALHPIVASSASKSAVAVQALLQADLSLPAIVTFLSTDCGSWSFLSQPEPGNEAPNF
jgi:hypothetical protein